MLPSSTILRHILTQSNKVRQELDELRTEAQEFVRLKAAYDHLKQDHDSLRVSFESSERIRKQQKELINLLQRSHSVVNGSVSGSSVVSGDSAVSYPLYEDFTPQEANPVTPNTVTKKAKKKTSSAPFAASTSGAIGYRRSYAKPRQHTTNNSTRVKNGSSSKKEKAVARATNYPNSSSVLDMMDTCGHLNNSNYNSNNATNSNTKEVSFSSQILLNSSLVPPKIRPTASLSPRNKVFNSINSREG